MLITQVKWTSLIQKNSLNFLYEIKLFHQILNFWISFPHGLISKTIVGHFVTKYYTFLAQAMEENLQSITYWINSLTSYDYSSILNSTTTK